MKIPRLAMIVFNGVVGIFFNLFLLWLLHRHRTAFTPSPPQTELAKP